MLEREANRNLGCRPRLLVPTRREWEVLALVAEGLSNREIAARLFVTEETVKDHLLTARQKIGAANRTAAARWWWERREERR